MKLSTATIHTVEISKDEEKALWNTPKEQRTICGKKLLHWLTDDGNNEVRLDGEDFYRPLVTPKIRWWQKLFCRHTYIEIGQSLIDCGRNKAFVERCKKCGKERTSFLW